MTLDNLTKTGSSSITPSRGLRVSLREEYLQLKRPCRTDRANLNYACNASEHTPIIIVKMPRIVVSPQ